MDDLYLGHWAGVSVCCCGSCSKWVFFFPVSVCGLGMKGFGKNLGSVVIGVLTGPWAAESWGLSMCISP